jgi:hypothetical protein
MKNILKNWDFMRFLRLGIGLWLAYAAFTEQQVIVGVMAALFLLQALLNIGCGSKGCNVSSNRRSVNPKIEDISFEEVK